MRSCTRGRDGRILLLTHANEGGWVELASGELWVVWGMKIACLLLIEIGERAWDLFDPESANGWALMNFVIHLFCKSLYLYIDLIITKQQQKHTRCRYITYVCKAKHKHATPNNQLYIYVHRTPHFHMECFACNSIFVHRGLRPMAMTCECPNSRN